MSMFATVKNLDLRHFENVKSAVEHVGLYVGLVVFTAAGAKIFESIEHPLEVETLEEVRELLLAERHAFVRAIFNGSWNSVRHRDHIDQRLLDYERTVGVAATQGIDMATKEPVYQWGYIQAVFFTSTILTTIGYGNIAPVSTAGRVFCILFAIVGIPFTLSVIADVGQIFATLVSHVWSKYKHVLKPIGKRMGIMRNSKDDDDASSGMQSNLLTALLALAFLTGFLSVGSLIFTSFEDWTFFEAFYFCFITMTTIGFGDIVPDVNSGEKTAYMLVCMIYILVGLAFTSTIIELVRRQYAESWRKMQELRAQIQAQLKLASTLRQMADANVHLEGLDLADDLAQLRDNIAKFKRGKFGKGLADIEIADLDWIEKNRKVKAVTIFFYESSV